MRHATLALLLLLIGQSTVRAQSLQDPPAGCYSLAIGEWSRPWPAEWHPPEIIRLDTVRAPLQATHMPAFLMLRPHAGLPARRGPEHSRWFRMPGDSLSLLWSGDYVTVSMRVRREGDSLDGLVQGSTDVIVRGEQIPQAEVRGRRVECPPSLQSELPA